MVMMLAGAVVPEDYHYRYMFAPCDSIRFIKEFNGAADTVIHTSDSVFDTSITDTDFDSTGVYFLYLELKYEGETYWVSGYDIAYNTYGVGYVLSAPVSTPTDSFLCRVYGYIRKADQTAVEGATVTGTFGRQNLLDTCNDVIITAKEIATNSDSVGYWYLDLTKSKCIQATDQKATITITFPGATTTVSKKITVPDSTSYWLKW